MNDLILLLQEVKKNWGIETVAAIQRAIEAEGAQFSNELFNSISYTQDDTLDGDISFTMADYGKFVDEGVNGLLQSWGSQYQFRGNWKGTAVAIKDWAAAKGLNQWALGHSIQKEGIKPRKFFNSVIESRLPDLATGLEQAYTAYLNQITNRQQRP